jgi:predicted nucleic acid-binding protein
MSGKFHLDTNIIIDYLKFRDDYLFNASILNESNFLISIITQIEPLCYKELTPNIEAKIYKLLNKFDVIPLDQEIAVVATSIRQKTNLKLPDAVVVATASVHGAVLVTNDNQLLKLDWPGLIIRSALDIKTTITTNNNDKNGNDNDNDNDNGNNNNNDNDNENKDNDN